MKYLISLFSVFFIFLLSSCSDGNKHINSQQYKDSVIFSKVSADVRKDSILNYPIKQKFIAWFNKEVDTKELTYNKPVRIKEAKIVGFVLNVKKNSLLDELMGSPQRVYDVSENLDSIKNSYCISHAGTIRNIDYAEYNACMDAILWEAKIDSVPAYTYVETPLTITSSESLFETVSVGHINKDDSSVEVIIPEYNNGEHKIEHVTFKLENGIWYIRE